MVSHRVVVVGAGFGGTALVHSLKGVDAEITLVDRRNHHLFQPLLYQVATSILSPADIAWPIRRLFRDRRDVSTVLGEVVSVDGIAKTVLLADGNAIPYDTLVIATGATHAYFGHDEWEGVAPGLKTIEDALSIRRHILLAFEQAEIERDLDERNALMTFAVIGGGPTGVELAGMIAEIRNGPVAREFRNIDIRSARVLLLEAGPRVLGSFPERLSRYTENALARRGVEVLTGQPVTNCEAKRITVGGRIISCRTILWAAGVKASDAAGWLKVPADKAGRVIVNEYLEVPGRADVFVIGDTACATRPDGRPVPGVAPAAKQQGKYIAHLVRNRLAGSGDRKPFIYKDQGSLATIGKRAAVIDFGRIAMTGWLAWWIWGGVHIFFLIGTRSRFSVAWSWLWIHLRGQRNARLITTAPGLQENKQERMSGNRME
ncbi:NAD(P)/FAD-dependent oxidoreductase [Rhizobium sp. A37_96]